MKKIIALFLIFSIIFSTSVFAEEIGAKKVGTSVVMAINENIAVVNGMQKEITAPVLALGRTYVDLYAVASVLGVKVNWIEAYIGYFKVSVNDKTQDFTLISQWSDLQYQQYKFFVKDSKIYVSLRELAEFAGQNIAYDQGIITIGNQTEYDKKLFGDISLSDIDDHIYKTYPTVEQHVVNPYQEYSYETMVEDANKLQHRYPDLIKLSSIGKSVEDRDLTLIEFGRGGTKIFVCATHHAREYITTTYVMYAIDRYANAYRTGSMWGKFNPKDILDNVTFCIVPMVNPDGVNLVINGVEMTKDPAKVKSMKIYESPQYGYDAWKANINGVDLNWNYDKDWSETKTRNPRGSAGFMGDAPGTEPETIAVSEYVDNNPFEAYISVHTQGEIFYWAENKEDPTYINELIKKETGFTEYTDDGTGIGGSFFDYVYRNFKKPTLTLELCPYVGNYPYPNEDFDTVWKPVKNVLFIVANEILYKLSK